MTEIDEKQRAAEGYTNLAFNCYARREYTKTKQYLEKALVIRQEIGDRGGEAFCHGSLGTVFRSLGEYGKTKESYEKSLTIRKEIGDRRGEGVSYGNLGEMFRILGEYSEAKECHEKALVISKETGDRKRESLCCGNLGSVFQFLGEYGKALEYHKNALQISKEIGDREGEAVDCGNLGAVSYSLGEYSKAREYHEKALAISKETGDKTTEGTSYGNLGTVFRVLGEYGKAAEHHEKALVIRKEIGDREGEAADYGNLGTVFHFLGEYDKAKDYYEKALAIRKEICDKGGQLVGLRNLGTLFHSKGEHEKAKECHEKALAISKEIGDREGEGIGYGNLGKVFCSLGEYEKAKECHERALGICKEIGNRKGEGFSYGNLGTVFRSLGEYDEAKEYYNKAIAVSKEIGDIELELRVQENLTWNMFLEKNTDEAFSSLFECVNRFEDMLALLKDNDKFKIFFSDEHASPFEVLSAMLCAAGNPTEALYVTELRRARALTDLMSVQYGVINQISGNPKTWAGIERIMEKETDCACLYTSYDSSSIFLWILKPDNDTCHVNFNVNHHCSGETSIRKLDKFLANDIIFRKFDILPPEHCEDRSWFSESDGQPALKSSEEEGPAAFRLFEDDEEEDQEPEPSLSFYYKLIIAPVANLIDEPEIIIVPDRSLYNVPFAALKTESGKYLSETLRIRIVPSLMTLKLIQDSPSDYHSQTGALIVGDPEVGHVMYKGRLERKPPLPCARKEAEMIGRLLGSEPLIGTEATKQAVLERINSVSLIHFAAHANAEKGEVALAPLPSTNGYPQEEDYLLTMEDISNVRLRAKLVVLSCCHSGSGQVRSEGVVGIARAFLGSGARSVLVALWALEDRATEQLMSRFYEYLVCGESASVSLQQAMKWMRDNGYSNVRDWAPFLLIGDDVTFDFGK